MFLEGIKDIKSLILTTISSDNGKEIGKGVLRYRRLIEFFQFFGDIDVLNFLRQDVSWDDLLKQLSIKEVVVLDGDSFAVRRQTYLVKEDETFYECRYHVSVIQRLSQEWNLFRKLAENLKESIIGAVLESEQPSYPHVRYRNQNFRDYIIELEEKRSTTTTTTTINPKTFDDVNIPDGPNYQAAQDAEDTGEEE